MEGWRLSKDKKGGCWDVERVRFLVNNSDIIHSKIISSGSVSDVEHGGIHGYAASNALQQGGSIWGGRADRNGEIWIGIVMPQGATTAGTVVPKLIQRGHPATRVYLQRAKNVRGEGHDANWETVRVLVPAIGSADGSLVEDNRAPPQCIPGDGWTCLPSRAGLSLASAPAYSRMSELQAPRATPFVPDPSFYNAIDCEGLWVLSTKQVEREVLENAATHARRWFSPRVRRMCATFRSPKWCKDPGPLRIIILDNRSKERAGMIPELKDNTGGRNSTMAPFVFTSREDFTVGVNGLWPIGRLTLHEGTHGMDMVIRQKCDPAFHWMVGDAYKAAMDKKIYEYYDENKRAVVPLYAAASRDEYLAEAMCIYYDKPQADGSNNYHRAGLRTRADLASKDPTIVRIIESYLA